jgi:hypothetical protein
LEVHTISTEVTKIESLENMLRLGRRLERRGCVRVRIFKDLVGVLSSSPTEIPATEEHTRIRIAVADAKWSSGAIDVQEDEDGLRN